MDTTPDQANHPKAFISHSSADKERFVLEFARRLRTDFGIDAWVDQWEIRPGDSFVERIYDHGIGQADAFLVVVSTNSTGSAWVRDELDAGTVDRIEKGTLLIPVILDGLQRSDIPKQLHHLHWVRVHDVGDLDSVTDEVARTISGHDPVKPPLGPPPAYATVDGAIPGMGPEDVALLLAIGDGSIDDWGAFEGNADALREKLAEQGVSDDAFHSSARFLYERGLLKDNPIGLSGTVQYFHLNRRGVRTYLKARGEDLDLLQRELAAYVVNHPEQQHHYKDLAEALGAKPLAVAAVAQDLDARNLLRVTTAMGNNCRISDPSESLRRMVR